MLKVKWVGCIKEYDKDAYGLKDCKTGETICEVCNKPVDGPLYCRYGVIRGYTKLICGHRDCLKKRR